MRGTTSVTQKYSKSGVTEHQVVRNITRAVSPAKDATYGSKRGSHPQFESEGHSFHNENVATPRRSNVDGKVTAERSSELPPQRLR